MCTASSMGLFLQHPFSIDLFHYCLILKFDSRDTYTHSLDLTFVQDCTAAQIKIILSPEEDSIQSIVCRVCGDLQREDKIATQSFASQAYDSHAFCTSKVAL